MRGVDDLQAGASDRDDDAVDIELTEWRGVPGVGEVVPTRRRRQPPRRHGVNLLVRLQGAQDHPEQRQPDDDHHQHHQRVAEDLHLRWQLLAWAIHSAPGPHPSGVAAA